MNVFPALIILFASVLVSPSAHAYLDPSTGSMIVTAIVGLFASIVLAVKTYWYKLKAFFKGSGKRGQAAASTPSNVSSSGQDSAD